MAVVAVLEIHMDRNMVVNMKPSISRAWLVPTCDVDGDFDGDGDGDGDR